MEKYLMPFLICIHIHAFSQVPNSRKIVAPKELPTTQAKSISELSISELLEAQRIENKKTIRQADEYTDIVHISTPSVIEIGVVSYVMPAYVYKTIIKDSVSYDIVFRTIALEYTPNAKGLFVIFKDGTKYYDLDHKIDISTPQKGREYTKKNTAIINLTQDDQDPPVTPKGYEYSARLTLNKRELPNFLTKPISKFKLFTYERILDADDSLFISDLSATLKAAK